MSFLDYILLTPKGAWSVKHPSGAVYTRESFAEAVAVATELSSRMKAHGIEHYRCRVYRTFGWTA